MGTLVTTLADPLASTLRLRIVDAAERQTLFDNFLAPAQAAYETAFNFGTRNYIQQSTPSALYVAQHRGWQSWGVLAAGTFATGLLGALLLLGTGHTGWSEKIPEKLREKEELIRIAQQAARWGAFEYDYNTGRNHWSPQIEALYGLEPGSFEGTYEGWTRRVHPEDRARTEKAMAHAAKTGEFSEHFRVVWKDGSVRWLIAHAKVFYDAEGVPQRMLGINLDITQRQHVEELGM